MSELTSRLQLRKSLTLNSIRTARGVYLIELLAAMFVSGLMALALTTSLTQGMSSSRSSQSQVLATWLAHQAMDRIKMSADQPTNSSFSSQKRIFDVLTPATLDFKITSNETTPVQPFDFLQRPLMLDFANLKWNSEDSSEIQPKNFHGKVQAIIEDRADSGKSVQIVVTWTDSTSSGQKQYSIRSAVFKN